MADGNGINADVLFALCKEHGAAAAVVAAARVANPTWTVSELSRQLNMTRDTVRRALLEVDGKLVQESFAANLMSCQSGDEKFVMAKNSSPAVSGSGAGELAENELFTQGVTKNSPTDEKVVSDKAFKILSFSREEEPKDKEILFNERYTRYVRYLINVWEKRNQGRKCPFVGRDAKQLKDMLRRLWDWSDDDIRACVLAKLNSEENPAEGLYSFLPRLENYAHGPLDRFGVPMKGGIAGVKSKGSRRTEHNAGIVERLLAKEGSDQDDGSDG